MAQWSDFDPLPFVSGMCVASTYVFWSSGIIDSMAASIQDHPGLVEKAVSIFFIGMAAGLIASIIFAIPYCILRYLIAALAGFTVGRPAPLAASTFGAFFGLFVLACTEAILGSEEAPVFTRVSAISCGSGGLLGGLVVTWLESRGRRLPARGERAL